MNEKTWTTAWGLEPIPAESMRLMNRALAVQKARPDLLIDGRTATHPAFDDWTSHQDSVGLGLIWDNSALLAGER